jgi:hypothetical protein
MADPMDPLRKQPESTAEERKIEPTLNDPTPHARQGDSRFLPVVILAGIALIVLLIAGVLMIKGKGHKMVPQEQDNHPTSKLMQPALKAGVPGAV